MHEITDLELAEVNGAGGLLTPLLYQAGLAASSGLTDLGYGIQVASNNLSELLDTSTGGLI